MMLLSFVFVFARLASAQIIDPSIVDPTIWQQQVEEVTAPPMWSDPRAHDNMAYERTINERIKQDKERRQKDWMMMYDFGAHALDMELRHHPNLDQQIDLNFYFPFYGFRYNYTFISPNGYIAFSTPRWIQPPYTFPNPKWPLMPDPSFIAPFFSDASFQYVGDSRISHVWYRTVHRPRLPTEEDHWTFSENTAGTAWSRRPQDRPRLQNSQAGMVYNSAILDSITRDIQDGIIGSHGFVAQYALIVTWERMAYGGAPKIFTLDQYEHAKRWQNSFQLVLATDEIRSYTIFNYATVNWTSTTSAGSFNGRGGRQSAMAGFNGGNNTGFTALPYSGQGDIFQLANFMPAVMPGRWVYRVDEQITYGGCSNSSIGSIMISPDAASMIGGIAMNISGPCLSPGAAVSVLFDDTLVACQAVNLAYARCVMPTLYKIGAVNIKMSTDGGMSYPFVGQLYVVAPHLCPTCDVTLRTDPRTLMSGWDEINPESLSLSWNNYNLTWEVGAMVDIEIWG